ncbi:MAG: serine hydrolase [Acidisphaera sp.]|nr:serine hydrolase [Acidisphaera sp.]
MPSDLRLSDPGLGDLDALVEAAMQEWRIPGLAVAVVRDGKTVLLKGYGQRDTETGSDLPVTTDTQFLICSLTKSFTAAGLGLLVDERRLDWNRPVREVLPEFRLSDPVATERLTVLDLLCHRSGLPRHDWIWSPGDISRAEMAAAMRHLEPSRDFREAFQYQNLGYLVAGMVAERISGHSWEEFTAERLLRPLGFSGFGFSIEALENAPDSARPHRMDGDERLRARLWPIRDTPAGGLNASIAGLANWLHFLLEEGSPGGKSILSREVVREMQVPRMHVMRSEFAELGDIHYGLGLGSHGYRGERVVAHSGGWIGWSSLLCLMPERRTGVAVLTNRDPNPVPEILAYAVFDQLCGRDPVDWLDRFRARRRQFLEHRDTDRQARVAARRPGTSPSHALEEYAGDYEHPAYGRMCITHENDGLAWRWRGLSGVLQHRHYDVFEVPENPAEFGLDLLAFTFQYDREGSIDRLSVPFEPMVADIVFRRAAAGEALDPAFRARCTGVYRNGPQRHEVRLDAEGQLTLSPAGQPTYRLVPYRDRVFTIAQLSGYRVEFRSATQGAAEAVIFHQPNGTFEAEREAD